MLEEMRFVERTQHSTPRRYLLDTACAKRSLMHQHSSVSVEHIQFETYCEACWDQKYARHMAWTNTGGRNMLFTASRPRPLTYRAMHT